MKKHDIVLLKRVQFFNVLQERRKDLTDYRDESTFSFDPSRIPVKQLQDRQNREKKKVDGRKGVLLSSVTRKRKKSRRRRTPSQQRSQQPEQQQPEPQQQQNTTDDRDGTVDGVIDAAEQEVEIVATMASEADVSAVAVALGDCEDGEDSCSRSSTPRRKPSRSPDPPAQPVTPPPQPEPPPGTSGISTAVTKPNVAADSLRPCALVAPQGE